MTNTPLNILLIGCGKMGSAMSQGWLGNQDIASINIVKPSPLPPQLQNQTQITYSASIGALPSKTYDIAILAVKPQMMDEVCEELKNNLAQDALILSIAAGKTLSYYETFFGQERPIIRTMPNTPTAIGQGITILCANKHVSPKQKQLTTDLLRPTGAIEEVEDEELLEAITPISGCGPAYIYYLMEILQQVGTELGIPAEQSERLARQTVIGSAALAAASPEISAETLRQNVTSKGGVTAAALEILMNGEMKDIFTKALAAAIKRNKELS